MPIKRFELIRDQETIPIWANDVGDGYHTISQLYNHRYALFTALVKAYDALITPLGPTTVKCWKSKLHSDGSSFEGWFIAGMVKRNLDETETQISYHLPMAWWDHLHCIELPLAPIGDGHTSNDVIERLIRL